MGQHAEALSCGNGTANAVSRGRDEVFSKAGQIDWPGAENVSDLLQHQDLAMTLITPCTVPIKSRWHVVTGSLVVASAYVAVVALLKWSLN